MTREDQIRRLARVLAYVKDGLTEFDGKNPLDDPQWLERAELYLDYVIDGKAVR